MSDDAKPRQRLEIPSERVDPFALRDESSSSRARATPPTISAPETSPLLARLEAFLPSLARANADLATRDAGEVSLEVEDEDEDAPRIEMVRAGDRIGRARWNSDGWSARE